LDRLKSRIPRRLRPLSKRLYLRLLPPAERRRQVAARFRSQAYWCRQLGSPLYGYLLERAADDVERDGPSWRVLRDQPPSPAAADDSLPLKFAGAVHRLTLDGRAPELAAHYPSAGGRIGEDAWPAFLSTVARYSEELDVLVRRPVQSNVVGRCAALLGGFLLVARDTGLPLRLLEVGASAGLNLNWHRYHYRADGETWGDPGSPVHITGAFAGPAPPLTQAVTVAERRGCDKSPLDPRSDDDRLTLLSFIWPDQERRLDLLRAALDLAAQDPARVDEADANDWLDERLAEPATGNATVVFQSFVLQFFDDAASDRFVEVLRRAGRAATREAPLAWLSMEWDEDGERADVRLTRWPEGEETLVARSNIHGRDVEWLEA